MRRSATPTCRRRCGGAAATSSLKRAKARDGAARVRRAARPGAGDQERGDRRSRPLARGLRGAGGRERRGGALGRDRRGGAGDRARHLPQGRGEDGQQGQDDDLRGVRDQRLAQPRTASRRSRPTSASTSSSCAARPRATSSRRRCTSRCREVEAAFRKAHTHLPPDRSLTRIRRPAGRGARGAAGEVLRGRGRDHRRQHADRRDRAFGDRDQRGQRRPQPVAAAGPHRDGVASRRSCRRSRTRA